MSDDVYRALGRIEGELVGLRQDINQHFLDDKENFGRINRQVDVLQKKIWFGSGFGAALGSLVTFWFKAH